MSRRFDRYMNHLSEGLGHLDRHAGLKGYCTVLMLPLARKSVEPIASPKPCGLTRIFQRTPVEARTALPFECPFIEVSNLDERAGNAETKLYRTRRA